MKIGLKFWWTLGACLIVLKLGDAIRWPWWLVLAPIYLPPIFYGVVWGGAAAAILLAGVIIGIVACCTGYEFKKMTPATPATKAA